MCEEARPDEIVEISSNFIGNFKVGDNLVYNANILCALRDANTDGDLNKMIVMQVGSILEAALGQIIYRAQNFKREGVSHIVEADRKEMEGKQVDKFNNVIDVMKKYKLLNDLGDGIYDELHKLRKHRNKVHIQDDDKEVPRDEPDAFKGEICTWSLELNVRVLMHLSQKFPRPPVLAGFAMRRMFEKRLVTDRLAAEIVIIRIFKSKLNELRRPYVRWSGGAVFHSYDFEAAGTLEMTLNDLANEIVHSSQLMFADHEPSIPTGLLIASDWHLNKRLLHLTIDDSWRCQTECLTTPYALQRTGGIRRREGFTQPETECANSGHAAPARSRRPSR